MKQQQKNTFYGGHTFCPAIAGVLRHFRRIPREALHSQSTGIHKMQATVVCACCRSTKRPIKKGRASQRRFLLAGSSLMGFQFISQWSAANDSSPKTTLGKLPAQAWRTRPRLAPALLSIDRRIGPAVQIALISIYPPGLQPAGKAPPILAFPSPVRVGSFRV